MKPPYVRYSNDELEDRYNEFMSVLKKLVSPERYELLEHMYSEDELGGSLVLSPASGRPHFHAAYQGGYIDHILNVVKFSRKLAKVYKSLGGTINFTSEELAMAAFHHDLGKLGTPDEMYYMINDSKWHIENRNEYFKHNPELEFMPVTDRAFFTLQKYGITLTENEMIGIRLTDGMYEEGNSLYLCKFGEDQQLRRTIPYILHWADHMAATIERESEFTV